MQRRETRRIRIHDCMLSNLLSFMQEAEVVLATQPCGKRQKGNKIKDVEVLV